MLVSFSVENFRSFRDRVTLDLRTPGGAAPGAKPWDGNLAPVAAIYGANASGKSNLVRAIRMMQSHVLMSYGLGARGTTPFAFDTTSKDRPTRFEIMVIAEDGLCYAYGYSMFRGTVQDEWAERYSSRWPTTLFHRTGSTLEFGRALRGPNRAVEATLKPSSLFLSAAMAANHVGLMPLWSWFVDQASPFPSHAENYLLSDVVKGMADNPEFADRLTGYLGRADLGISGLDVSVITGPIEPGDLLYVTGDTSPAERQSSAYRAFSRHGIDGQEFTLPLGEESDGTLAMLCHAYILEGTMHHGATIIFDELDASLHPLLVRELVTLFKDPARNPNQAQLIFTTHNSALLDSGYLDGAVVTRDDMWLTERDRHGVSTLASVIECGAGKRDNLAPRYLAGRYGGVPEPLPLLDPMLV